MLTYPECIQKLYTINRHSMKLGLENMLKLDAAFGYPSRSFEGVHVAGTNGKGSVCTKMAAALQASGKRVGLYTSPHIASFRERIRIDGEMISEEGAKDLLNEIFQTNISATFFEVTTLLAFLCFARQKVDIAVLEVGLGGRLDATNIVTPCLSIITSISLEHTDILGTTLEAIAREKAGIIKPNVPIVAGPRTEALIASIAHEQNSPYIKVGGSFATYELENQAVAKRGMEQLRLSQEAIAAGIALRPPCRLEEVAPGVILDVAHNPDGLEQLFRALRKNYPGKAFRVVCGLSKNKDLRSCLSILQQNSCHIHLTEAPGDRAAKAAHLAELVATPVSVDPDVTRSIQNALQAQKNELLVICGTFFIMAAARRALGINEPWDSLPLCEKFVAT